MAQITYQNKADINVSTTPIQNKVSATDMNEIKSAVNSNTPIGTISMYAGTSDPSGWFICDGRAVSRTTYANLFGVIGTSFGSGDGSTTFNIPDFKGNVAVGLNSNDSDFDTIGNTYGEKTHTLTRAELPQIDIKTNYASTSGGSGNGLVYGTKAGDSKNILVVNDNYGQTPSHNNVQPSVVVNYIISY